MYVRYLGYGERQSLPGTVAIRVTQASAVFRPKVCGKVLQSPTVLALYCKFLWTVGESLIRQRTFNSARGSQGRSALCSAFKDLADASPGDVAIEVNASC